MTPTEAHRRRYAARGTDVERAFWTDAQGPPQPGDHHTEPVEELPVSAQPTPAENMPVPMSEKAIAAFDSMLAAIPEVGEDAWLSILSQIAEATTVEALDSPWKAGGLEDLKDTPIRITAIRRAPSDFESGFGAYLIADCVRLDTGEKVVVTTGAVSVVAQLARAHALNALPLTVIPRVAARASANGFHPQHLEISKVQAK